MVETAASDRVASSDWTALGDEQLLDVRMCDLALRIEGTDLEQRIAQINAELDARGLRFRPHYWLADEWFTPDGVPGVAIPFYLAHPRLARLELAQMLEVEGGDPDSCLRILCHEVGHAIDNAYRLGRIRLSVTAGARPTVFTGTPGQRTPLRQPTGRRGERARAGPALYGEGSMSERGRPHKGGRRLGPFGRQRVMLAEPQAARVELRVD